MPLTTSPQVAETRSHPAVVALCMFITVIEGFNLIMYGSVVPLLLDDTSLGLTDQEAGLVGGLVYVGAIPGALAAPWLADRIGRKNVLLVAIGLFAVGGILAGSAVSAPMLALARFITGLGIGGSLTTAMTTARNSAASTHASLVVTITMAGIPLGGVVAALSAIPVLPTLGWRPMFFIGAATALIIVAVVRRTTLPTDTPQELADRLWSTRRKLGAMVAGRGTAATLLIAACAIANMVAWQGLNVWSTEAMIDLGFSLDVALSITFTLTGAAVLGSFVTAWAADRRSPALIAIVTSACTLMGLIGMILIPLSLPTTVACVALMGIGGHSTMNLVHTTAADIFPLPVRATALGWSNGTSFVGAFLGPVLGGGAMAAGGARGVFSMFVTAACICLVAVISLYVTDRTTHANARTDAAGRESRGVESLSGETRPSTGRWPS